MSRAIDAEETGISFGSQHVARPLLTPDEVRTMPANLELLFLAGQRPIVATKLAYYADREFAGRFDKPGTGLSSKGIRSEEHTSELQSLMRISYAVFCLKEKKNVGKK